MTKLWQILGLKVPVIQAPMYGVSTPALVAKATKLGALGSFGAGVLPPTELKSNLDDIVNQLPDKQFNLNLFVENGSPAIVTESKHNWHVYEDLLKPVRDHLDLDSTPRLFPQEVPSNVLEGHLELVHEYRPSVVSFCFGVLDRAIVREIQAFAHVIGTATTVEEAVALDAAGVDAIVAQGSEAGGHRGTFLADPYDSLLGTMALVPQICDAVRVPVIAAGGITDRRHVQAALALGAEAVQVGTAFMGTPESAASPAWKEALGKNRASTATTVTRGLTGRHARMLRNTLVDILQPHELQAATSSLQRSRMSDIFRQKHGEYSVLLAGQSHRMATSSSVEEVFERLVGST